MELLRMLESIRSPFLDTVIGLITRIGEETIAIVVLCAIYWCINKRIAYGIGVTYFLSGLTVQGMKICFRIERPWVIDPTFNPVPSALKHATGFSFPSGHTQSAAALFGSLGARIKHKAIKILFFSLILVVAFSRMYLGVHTLLDVSVSIVVSLILVWFTIKMLDGDMEESPSNGKEGTASIASKRALIFSFSMILYAFVVIIITSVLYSNGTIVQSYLSDCLKAAGAGIGFAVGMYIERVYISFPVKSKNLLWQILKFILGIAGVLAIKEGLKLIIGTGIVVDPIRYFLMLMWMTIFFPMIIKKVQQHQ